MQKKSTGPRKQKQEKGKWSRLGSAGGGHQNLGVPPSDSSWRSASTLEVLSTTSLGDQGTVLPQTGIRPVPGAMAIIAEPSSWRCSPGNEAACHYAVRVPFIFVLRRSRPWMFQSQHESESCSPRAAATLPPFHPLPHFLDSIWEPLTRAVYELGASWLSNSDACTEPQGAGKWERTAHSLRVSVTKGSTQTTEGKNGSFKGFG